MGSLLDQGKMHVELLGENAPSVEALATFFGRNKPFFSPDKCSGGGTKEASHENNAERHWEAWKSGRRYLVAFFVLHGCWLSLDCKACGGF